MLLEFSPDRQFNFIKHFATYLNVTTNGDDLVIPDWLGTGLIRNVPLAPDFQLTIHHYTLKEELILKRVAPNAVNDTVRILFNMHQYSDSSQKGKGLENSPDQQELAIRITTDSLSSEMYFPADTDIYFTVIGLKRQQLQALLDIKKPNKVIQTILNGTDEYLFYESMSLRVQDILKQLTNAVRPAEELNALYCRIKILELIHALFVKLLMRDTKHHYPINKADVDKLFLIKESIMADLSKPPQLASLAQVAGLSQTKMTDLFKQVFGDSIYNYYQKARLEKGAWLIRTGELSVSDVGYRLGFSNLSHFSRLFEKHFGIKPKKYSFGG